MEISEERLPKSIGRSVKLFIFQDLNSQTPNHRLLLRQNLVKLLKSLRVAVKDPTPLLNLEQPPNIPGVGISLSHCHRGSALLLDLKGRSVGVDLEETQRITSKVVARIARPSELNSVPSTQLLFTAKEAAWKALNKKLRIAAISQIETHQWSQVELGWYGHNVSFNDVLVGGQGYCTQNSDTCLSFFISH